MANHPIYTNSTVKIYARIKDETGTLVDPAGIDFYITEPGIGATAMHYTYGIGTTIQTSGTGIFYVEWLPADPGKYKYTWETSGDVQSSFKSFFEVEDSRW